MDVCDKIAAQSQLLMDSMCVPFLICVVLYCIVTIACVLGWDAASPQQERSPQGNSDQNCTWHPLLLAAFGDTVTLSTDHPLITALWRAFFLGMFLGFLLHCHYTVLTCAMVINSIIIPILGMVINPLYNIGINMPIVGIPIMGWMTIPPILCFDHGTYGTLGYITTKFKPLELQVAFALIRIILWCLYLAWPVFFFIFFLVEHPKLAVRETSKKSSTVWMAFVEEVLRRLCLCWVVYGRLCLVQPGVSWCLHPWEKRRSWTFRVKD